MRLLRAQSLNSPKCKLLRHNNGLPRVACWGNYGYSVGLRIEDRRMQENASEILDFEAFSSKILETYAP